MQDWSSCIEGDLNAGNQNLLPLILTILLLLSGEMHYKKIIQKFLRYCWCNSSAGLAIDLLVVILILISSDHSSCEEAGLNARGENGSWHGFVKQSFLMVFSVRKWNKECLSLPFGCPMLSTVLWKRRKNQVIKIPFNPALSEPVIFLSSFYYKSWWSVRDWSERGLCT